MDGLDRLMQRTGEENEDLLYDLLQSAEAVILSRRYPFGEYPDDFPRRYEDLKVRIAEDMYNRIGASGQLSHSENGISRTWGAEWVSEQLLGEIVPMVGGLR
jgi:hypothetical protein